MAARNIARSALYSVQARGSGDRRSACGGEESPGSTETTVPDNVRRLPQGGQGKCHRDETAKGFGPAKGERVR